MADDFFKKEEKAEVKEEVKVEEPEKIKLGEEEYTQDDLNNLVGLGKIAKEAEEKYNVKVEGIWPKFQQTINENVEFRKKEEEEEKVKQDQEINKKAVEGTELTEEEQLQLAKTKLKDLGFVSKEDIDQQVSAILAGRELLEETKSFVDEQEKAGNPKTNTEDLLTYMDDNGIKRPDIAYEIKFKKELDVIKEQKIGGIKKDQFVTEEKAGAGVKNPEAKPLTRHNLTEALSDALNRES